MVWQNWGLDRFQLNGWWVISKRSVHLEGRQGIPPLVGGVATLAAAAG